MLDPRGGEARAVTPGLIDFNLRGFYVGLDLDPIAGSLRVVNDADQNFRLDPFTGRAIDYQPSSQFVEPDADLRYPRGDQAEGESPNVSAIAFSPSGQLFGIDTARDTLVTIAPADDGVVHTIGPLGINAEDPAGVRHQPGRRLGHVPPGRERGDGALPDQPLPRPRHQAVAQQRDRERARRAGGPAAVDARPGRSRRRPAQAPLLGRRACFAPVGLLLRRRPLKLVGACNEAVADRPAGARPPHRGKASTRIRDTGGSRRFDLRLSARGRGIVRRARGGRLRLRAVAVDAAGNRATLPKAKKP